MSGVGSAGAQIDDGGLHATRTAARELDIHSGLTTTMCDISDEAEVAALYAGVDSDLGGLDAVVNAAGILVPAHTHEMSLDLWNTVIGVNLTGTFLMCRGAIPRLIASPRDGVIVNFS